MSITEPRTAEAPAAPPPAAGFAVAVLAAPAVLAADALHKRARARQRRR